MQITLDKKIYTFYRIGEYEYIIHITSNHKNGDAFGGWDYYNAKNQKENNHIEFNLYETLQSTDHIKTYADFSDFKWIFKKYKELADM